MGGTAWVARPDSRSQDLEGRASWVGPSAAGQPAVMLLGGVSRKSKCIKMHRISEADPGGRRKGSTPSSSTLILVCSIVDVGSPWIPRQSRSTRPTWTPSREGEWDPKWATATDLSHAAPIPHSTPTVSLWKFKNWLGYVNGGERDLQPRLRKCHRATDPWPQEGSWAQDACLAAQSLPAGSCGWAGDRGLCERW